MTAFFAFNYAEALRYVDHIGGLINVMEAIIVNEVIDPAVKHTTKTFEDYLTVIGRNEIKFTVERAGMTRDLGGGATMIVVSPINTINKPPE